MIKSTHENVFDLATHDLVFKNGSDEIIMVGVYDEGILKLSLSDVENIDGLNGNTDKLREHTVSGILETYEQQYVWSVFQKIIKTLLNVEPTRTYHSGIKSG